MQRSTSGALVDSVYIRTIGEKQRGDLTRGGRILATARKVQCGWAAASKEIKARAAYVDFWVGFGAMVRGLSSLANASKQTR